MHSLVHRPFPRAQIEQSIQSRFAAQVSCFPDRPAICSPRHRWTYKELARRVDVTASALLHRVGVGEGRVALIFDHGAPMIAGMLATLRAGKTYVPLDPGYPEQRLRMMLQDSDAEALLIEQGHRDLAQSLGGAGLPILVDGQDQDAAETTFPAIDPRALAYILYTSGSTGRPKGVVQNHRNVLHFIRAYTNNLLLAPSDRMSLLSSYSFDAAVMGIYGGLLNGACVYPRNVRDEGFGDLGAWIRQNEISVYHSTPTVFREFLAASNPGQRFGSVRRVVLGGEAVVRRDVERFKDRFDRGAILVNGLGPTESTITLQNFIDHDTELKRNLVPVGRPVCDTRIVLRDDAGRPSENEGEMVFVSEHVALEYWHRPELTERAFGDWPDAPGLRWYRSGDLARRIEDGSLEFLGRVDTQVKIHGVRIELGEVEAALQQQVAVAEAAAVVRTLPGSDLPRLIAYVRRLSGSVGEEKEGAERILEQLRNILPSAMVPSLIVFLDALPKTPTGKIDRLALPDPSRDPVAVEQDPGYVPPASVAEAKLAQLWQDMLGIDKISVTRDLQSLGGDSLTALRIVFKMKALGIPQDVARGILNGKTIRELAGNKAEAPASTALSREARLNLLVNITRGILLASVIIGHSVPAIVRRLPGIASKQQALDALFDVATPGFAFVFGLTLGKVYYPRFRLYPTQTQRMLWSSTGILFASLLIFAVPLELQHNSQDTVLRWIMLHNVILYYTLAFATAALWFRFMALFQQEFIGCLVLIFAFCATRLILSSWVGAYDELNGNLGVGMLVTKFNYFNMSAGVLGGCLVGMYLFRNAALDLSVLARKSFALGAACVALGLALLYLQPGSFALLGADDRDMGLWRWSLYSGVVLVSCGPLARALARVESWPARIRQVAEFVATIGQCTFPIFVVHIILWPLKAVLNDLGVPDVLGSTLLLSSFAVFCLWCVISLHRLHYGGSDREPLVRISGAQTQPSSVQPE